MCGNVHSTNLQPKCSVPIETEHRTVRDSTIILENNYFVMLMLAAS